MIQGAYSLNMVELVTFVAVVVVVAFLAAAVVVVKVVVVICWFQGMQQ